MLEDDDAFDFDYDIGSLGESDNEPAYIPPPKQNNIKKEFSNTSEKSKPNNLLSNGME